MKCLNLLQLNSTKLYTILNSIFVKYFLLIIFFGKSHPEWENINKFTLEGNSPHHHDLGCG